MAKRKSVAAAAAAIGDNLPETPKSEARSSSTGVMSGDRVIEPTRSLQTKKVDPKKCRVWAAHDRNQLWFNEKDCADLIQSFQTLGQQKTAIVRPVVDDSNYRYEIIEGARRRWTAEFLGMPLEVEVRHISDAEAAAMMESENADRQDISPFERAQSYDRLLKMNVFETREELCKAMNVSKAQLAKMLTAASLLEVDELGEKISTVINDPREISIAGAYKLMGEWNKSPDFKAAILSAVDDSIQSAKSQTVPQLLKRLSLAPYDQPKKKKETYWHSNGSAILTAEKAPNGKITFAVNKPAAGVKKSDIKRALNEALTELLD